MRRRFFIAVILYAFADRTPVPDPVHPYAIHHHGGGVSYFGDIVGAAMDDAWLVSAVSFVVGITLTILFGERKSSGSPC